MGTLGVFFGTLGVILSVFFGYLLVLLIVKATEG